MRKYLNFYLLIALLSVFTVVSAQRGNNSPRTPRTSVIVSTDQQPFWLFLDDVLQNENPALSVKVEAVPEGEHYLRVEMDNPAHNTIGQFVQLQSYRNAYWIDNQRNMFGISIDRGNPKPETVVFFQTARQNRPHTPYTQNNTYNNPPAQQNPPVAPHPEPIPAVAVAMSTTDFQLALSAIKSESFETTKVATAEQILENNLFTVNQIQQICSVFDYEKTKLEFAKKAYSHCTEKEKYYLLNSVFDYNTSKAELNKFVRQQQ